MQIKYKDRKTDELITENPPAEGLLKFLYNNPFGRTAILPLVKRKFVSEWYGRRMSHPRSVRKIQGFIDQLGIDMSESANEIYEFQSFNEFFYRKLKPESRPIDEGFVSPGDGKLIAFEDISDVRQFFVKGRSFTLNEFLNDENLAEKYADSSMLILRLAPNDYHRFHFPLDGIPSEMKKIKGSYCSVSPYAIAGYFTKVFCENKREYCQFESHEFGDILIAPVGATMVGSIIETYIPEKEISKGDEMGYFAFGGSTIVVLVDKKKLQIDKDILENTRNEIETGVKMGESIGRLKIS